MAASKPKSYGTTTSAKRRDHLTVEERTTLGLTARASSPRRALGIWQPPQGRIDPIDILASQDETRLQHLVPVRYGRMLASPFAFYRGAAAIMANDLQGSASSGFTVQLCGDAHLANFGFYASPERSLVFDINDFDETLPGPWEYDLKRLVTSFVIAAQHRGFDRATTKTIAMAAATTYRDVMAKLAPGRVLDIWYSSINESAIQAWAESLEKRDHKKVTKAIQKAKSNTSQKAVAKLTQVVDGKMCFIEAPTLQPLPADLHDVVLSEFRTYRRTLRADRRLLLEKFHLVDAALKVVGVGSVGTRSFLLLFEGRDEQDPLVLQVKQANRSVLEAAAPPSNVKNQGQRVVVGQHALQSASDIFLGWVNASTGDDFYVRQYRDWKYSIDLESITTDQLHRYARWTAGTLAKAHARIGDPVAIAAYIGKGDVLPKAIVEFGLAYAQQNALDYQSLASAVKTGRVQATVGV